MKTIILSLLVIFLMPNVFGQVKTGEAVPDIHFAELLNAPVNRSV